MQISEMLMRAMQDKMTFTLWDVEHGLAMWIKTPRGQNHWIDAGHNVGQDFSPVQHVYNVYNERELDYLIISHPDCDHIQDLPEVVRLLQNPRVLLRNKLVPESEKYGGGSLECQRVYRRLDQTYNSPVDWNVHPANPAYNGGISITSRMLSYEEAGNLNNTSVVVFYSYAEWLFVLPGDIDPSGWSRLWQKHAQELNPIVAASRGRILVAPHHGTASGYSTEMMNAINPHLVLVSDDWGGEPTDYRYRIQPIGLQIAGETRRYLTTKNEGANPSRIKVVIYEDGAYQIQQLGENQV